jgi:uncharacterized repeat protein (TIGR01451 family)
MLKRVHGWPHRLLAWLVSVSLVIAPLPARADLRAAPPWFDGNAVGAAPDWHYRVPINVPAGATVNSTIKVDVNFNTLLAQMGVSGTFDVDSPRVVRPNGTLAATQEFTDGVFADATDAAGDGKGEVRFLLEDAGPSTYYLYFDITQNGAKPANPQTPINGNFEQSAVAGTQNPPQWTATKTNAAFDTQLRPSESPSIGTNGAVSGNGAQPRITDGTPHTGGFSYLMGSRTANDPVNGNPAVTLSRTIVVPATNPGNLVLRYRVEGWDSGANGNNTQFDFLRISVVGGVTTEIVGPTAGNYTTFPFSPNLGAVSATATRSGYGQYNGWDTDTTGAHRSGMTLARGSEPWFTRTFNLAPFAGQTVTLNFASSHTTTYRTWFHVDNVEWSVVSGTLGTPQAFGVNVLAPNDTAAGAASAFVAGNRLLIRAQVDAAPSPAANQVTADVFDQNGVLVASGVRLFNDGTHGDAVANDNIWSNDGSVPADPTYTFLATDAPGTAWRVRVYARDGSTSTVGASNGLIRIPGQPNTPATQANFYNIDEQTFTLSAPPTVTKLSTLISDPVNGTINPKRIPGAIVEYTVVVTNPGVAMTTNTVVITDVLSPSTALCVSALCGGAPPVSATDGTPTSGLAFGAGTVTYSSTAAPGIFTYTPVAGADGCDANNTRQPHRGLRRRHGGGRRPQLPVAVSRLHQIKYCL